MIHMMKKMRNNLIANSITMKVIVILRMTMILLGRSLRNTDITKNIIIIMKLLMMMIEVMMRTRNL